MATAIACDPEVTMIDETPTPEDIAKLEAAVGRRLGGQVRMLEISFENGGIVLRGVSLTYYAKQLAQHYAMESTDLAIRTNDIEVK